MKSTLFKIAALFLFAIAMFACEMDSSLDNLYDEYDDHKVFLLEAEVSPLNNEMSLGDTLWVSVDASDMVFQNLITGNYLALDTAMFLAQIQLYDRTDKGEVVDMQMILKSGKSYDAVEVPTNAFGFSFDATNDYQLKVGIIFNVNGKYAVAFNNYPNPTYDGGQGYRYDVYHGWDTADSTYANKDFVDYQFELDGAYYDAPDLSDYQYILNNCIYEESVFFVTIK